jgi:hypothetical protein
MAEKRMFTVKITESDAFLDMPMSTQCLYFHLCMYADDEGFIKNPKRIQKMIGANEDDMKLLVAKSFVLEYESGVIVIKHWKMHNAIRKDRLHETEYIEEKSMLYVKENGAYTLDSTQGKPLLSTKCQPNVNQVTTKPQPNDRIGLDLDLDLGLDKEKDKKESRHFVPPTLSEVKAYCQDRVREGHPAVNPERFIDFYESKGWMVGKNKMKDWKAAVRTWENRRNEEKGESHENIEWDPAKYNCFE